MKTFFAMYPCLNMMKLLDSNHLSIWEICLVHTAIPSISNAMFLIKIVSCIDDILKCYFPIEVSYGEDICSFYNVTLLRGFRPPIQSHTDTYSYTNDNFQNRDTNF
uniref:Uncharacterized protein n=1 Tax=Arundo donax TaxID=35708 RepID=A0A0A9HA53_ARUDO